MKRKRLAIIGSISLSFGCVLITTGFALGLTIGTTTKAPKIQVQCDNTSVFNNNKLTMSVFKKVTLNLSGGIAFTNASVSSNMGDKSKLSFGNVIVDKKDNTKATLEISANSEIDESEIITISADGYQDSQIAVTSFLNNLNVKNDPTSSQLFGKNLAINQDEKSTRLTLSGDINLFMNGQQPKIETSDDITAKLVYSSETKSPNEAFIDIKCKKAISNPEALKISAYGYNDINLNILTETSLSQMVGSCTTDGSSFQNNNLKVQSGIETTFEISGDKDLKNLTIKNINSNTVFDKLIFSPDSNNKKKGTISFKNNSISNIPEKITISADGYEDYTFFASVVLNSINFSSNSKSVKILNNALSLKVGQDAIIKLDSNVDLKNVTVTGNDDKLIISKFMVDKQNSKSGTITFNINSYFDSFENIKIYADNCEEQELVVTPVMNDLVVTTDKNSNYMDHNLQLTLNQETTLTFSGDVDFNNATVESLSGQSAFPKLEFIKDGSDSKKSYIKLKTSSAIKKEGLKIQVDKYNTLVIFATTKKGELNLSIASVDDKATYIDNNLTLKVQKESAILLKGDFGIKNVNVSQDTNSKLSIIINESQNSGQAEIKFTANSEIKTFEKITISADGYDSKTINVFSEKNEMSFTSYSNTAILNGNDFSVVQGKVATLSLDGDIDFKNVTYKINNDIGSFDISIESINGKNCIINFKSKIYSTKTEKITISADGYKDIVINATSSLYEFSLNASQVNGKDRFDSTTNSLNLIRTESPTVTFSGETKIKNFHINNDSDSQIITTSIKWVNYLPVVTFSTKSEEESTVDMKFSADNYAVLTITVKITKGKLVVKGIEDANQKKSIYDASKGELTYYGQDDQIGIEVEDSSLFSIDKLIVSSSSSKSDYKFETKENKDSNWTILISALGNDAKTETITISCPGFTSFSFKINYQYSEFKCDTDQLNFEYDGTDFVTFYNLNVPLKLTGGNITPENIKIENDLPKSSSVDFKTEYTLDHNDIILKFNVKCSSDKELPFNLKLKITANGYADLTIPIKFIAKTYNLKFAAADSIESKFDVSSNYEAVYIKSNNWLFSGEDDWYDITIITNFHFGNSSLNSFCLASQFIMDDKSTTSFNYKEIDVWLPNSNIFGCFLSFRLDGTKPTEKWSGKILITSTIKDMVFTETIYISGGNF